MEAVLIQWFNVGRGGHFSHIVPMSALTMEEMLFLERTNGACDSCDFGLPEWDRDHLTIAAIVNKTVRSVADGPLDVKPFSIVLVHQRYDG